MAAQNGLRENGAETQESLGDVGGSFANDGLACKIRRRTPEIRGADAGYEETLSDSKLCKGSRCVPRIMEEDDVSVCDCLLQCWSRQSVGCRIGFGDEGLAEVDDGFCWSENRYFSEFWRSRVAWF